MNLVDNELNERFSSKSTEKALRSEKGPDGVATEGLQRCSFIES